MKSSFALVRVPEGRIDEMLDEFFNTSAFTFEGLEVHDKKGMRELERELRENGFTAEDMVVYWFKGSDMNKKYHLTDDNAYSDDLTFAVIPNFYNPIFKLCIGARWFDDIVQNNAYREAEKLGVM